MARNWDDFLQRDMKAYTQEPLNNAVLQLMHLFHSIHLGQTFDSNWRFGIRESIKLNFIKTLASQVSLERTFTVKCIIY